MVLHLFPDCIHGISICLAVLCLDISMTLASCRKPALASGLLLQELLCYKSGGSLGPPKLGKLG